MPISVELRFGSTLSKNVIYVSIFELARASVMYFNRELDFLVGNNFFLQIWGFSIGQTFFDMYFFQVLGFMIFVSILVD